MAKYADAALYVVRQDLAATTQIVNSLQTLATADLPMLGYVLNYSTAEKSRYGYYGYGEEKRRKK